MSRLIGYAVLLAGALSLPVSAFAESVRGNYQGIGFTAEVNSDRSSAKIVWDDGAPGVVLPATNTPSEQLRCPCIYFEEAGRLLAVRTGSNGELLSAYYQRVRSSESVSRRHTTVRGNYQGSGFSAHVTPDQSSVSVVWDDGVAAGFSLPRTNNPSQTVRCDCIYFEAYPRLIAVTRGPGGELRSAHYVRLDRN